MKQREFLKGCTFKFGDGEFCHYQFVPYLGDQKQGEAGYMLLWNGADWVHYCNVQKVTTYWAYCYKSLFWKRLGVRLPLANILPEKNSIDSQQLNNPHQHEIQISTSATR